MSTLFVSSYKRPTQSAQSFYVELTDNDTVIDLSIESSWHAIHDEQKLVRDVNVQTVGATPSEIACQTEAGTDVCSGPPTVGGLNCWDAQVSKQGNGLHILSPECQRWLNRVAPVVERQLQDNIESTAFDSYNTQHDADTGDYSVYLTLHIPPPTLTPEQQQAKQRQLLQEQRTGIKSLTPMYDASTIHSNCNGSTISLSYGSFAHSGWCSHKSSIALWNILHRQIDSNVPDILIDSIESCIMSVAWHPTIPTLFVIGLYDGTLQLYDLSTEWLKVQYDDPRVCTSVANELTHREPIASLCWQYDTVLKQHLMVSTAGDGKVLVWSIDNLLRAPYEGYQLKPNAIYSGQRSLTHSKTSVVGASQLAVPHTQASPNQYLVGTEGGGLVRCRFNDNPNRAKVSATPAAVLNGASATLTAVELSKKGQYLKSGELKWHRDVVRLYDNMEAAAKPEGKRLIEKHCAHNNIQVVEIQTLIDAQVPIDGTLYKNPINFAYSACKGSVYGLAFHPTAPQLFIAASTDASIRLHHVQRQQPLLTMDLHAVLPLHAALYGIAWSPVRPLVFATSDSIGNVHIVDLLQNTAEPVLTIKHNESGTSASSNLLNGNGVAGTNSIAVVSCSWLRDGTLLSSVDVGGVGRVWQLGSQLSTVQLGEKQMLQRLTAVDVTDGIDAEE